MDEILFSDQEKVWQVLISSYELADLRMYTNFGSIFFKVMPYFIHLNKAYESPTWFNANTRILII